MAGPGDPDSAVFLPRSPPSDAKRIPHADLGASALFSAYADGDPRALAFYAHDPWDAGARAEAAHRAAAHPRDRATLADVLAEQQARWGADEAARANAERLREPESAAVVTGQQLGLFGGPLYTLYKALTAVQLASRLAEETGRPVVPVFWLADEDHDFAEVHATAVLSEDGPVRVAYEDGHQASLNRGAVGRLVLGEGIVIVLDAVAAALPRGRHTGALLDDLRTTWAPGARWRDAFARQLASWTAGTGLVLLSADDVRLKRLAAPLFHREVERWPDTHAVHADASARLVAEGFHAQVTPRPFHF
ncbi:MAG TPA: bacillithiol biosynthesis BshC, partial [Rubricoccaceae bacterium]|nr:bacillithiol biosynthesis BshC [Rubricoccaceae bacterium]